MATLSAPRRRGCCLAFRFLGLVSLLSACGQLEAANKFWGSTSGGSFSSSSNWQSCGFFCNPVPGANDVAHFGLSDPSSIFTFFYTVTFANNPTTSSLLIEDDVVTFDLNGHTYTNAHSPFVVATQIGNQSGRGGSLNVTDGLFDINSGLFVGIAGGNGGLRISSGGSVQSENFARIGASTSSGTVNVTGASSQWLHAGELSVGWGGTGTMNITDGALVQGVTNLIADGSGPGTVSVSGTNSRWINSAQMFIGNGGKGTLNITAGGRVRNTAGHIGFAATNISTVNVDAAQWTNSGDLFVGDLGSGLMNVTGGGLVQSVNSAIGAAPGSAGAVAVASSTNIASNWVNSGELNVGHSGAGTLEILTAGAVFSTNAFIGRFAGSSGVATVKGPDATWTNSGNLTVGNNGHGELTITNRAVVQSVHGSVAAGVGSTGSVRVAGPLAFWFNSGELTVGREGDGTMDITGGGFVQNTNGYIGRSTSGLGSAAVTVNGAGSTWNNTNFVYVGFDSQGEGSLSVQAGGTVNCTTGFVGNVAGSHGTATVDGTGSKWTTNGTLAVGDGTLTISNGGTVVTNGLFGTLAAENSSHAEVNVIGQGSSWSLPGALLTVGFGGAAEVNVLAGANLVSLDARLAADAPSDGTVLVSGAGSTWTVGGKLGVGGDAATLASGGDGTLNIQPGGTVNVAQNMIVFPEGLVRLQGGTLDAAGISGQLQLALIDGFAPAAGDTFTVLTAAAGIFGTFANVANGQRLTTLDSLGSFLVHYGPASAFNPNQVILSAFEPAELPGDFNLDGRVDAADYTVWRDGLGSSYTMAGYDIWKAHFGQSLAAAATGFAAVSPAVPEPTSMAILGLALSMSLARARRSRP